MRVRSIGVGRSSAQRAQVSWPARQAWSPPGASTRKRRANIGRNGAGEADLLRRRIDPRVAGDREGVAAVPAPGQRDPRGVERVGPFGARADGEDRGAHRGLGEADAELAAEGGGPGPAGEHHAAGADRSGLGDDAGDPAGLELEAAGGAGLMHAGTETHRTAGDDRGGALGIGGAVGGGEDAALPGLGRSREPRSVASADDSMLVTTPWVRAKSRQRAQPAISASSFER